MSFRFGVQDREQRTLSRSRVLENGEQVLRYRARRECVAVRPPLRRRPEEEVLVIAGSVRLAELDSREQVRLIGVRQKLDAVVVPEMTNGHTQIEERRAAADDELAIVGIDDRQRARPVGVEQQRIAVCSVEPRLAVVAGRCADGVAEEVDELREGGARLREFPRPDFDLGDAGEMERLCELLNHGFSFLRASAPDISAAPDRGCGFSARLGKGAGICGQLADLHRWQPPLCLRVFRERIGADADADDPRRREH